jgi:hypothetical protein
VIKTNTGLPVPYSAVLAWEPFAGQVDPTLSFWDDNLNYNFAPSGARWIWESYRPVHPVEGDIVHFQKTFSLDGYPTAGMLHITCDNGYEAWLNGHLVGSAWLGVGWEASNLTNAFVGGMWPLVGAYDVASLLVKGTNTLIVKAANEYEGGTDLGGLDVAGEPWGTVDINPAGLIFQLDIISNTCPPAS